MQAARIAAAANLSTKKKTKQLPAPTPGQIATAAFELLLAISRLEQSLADGDTTDDRAVCVTRELYSKYKQSRHPCQTPPPTIASLV